MPVEVFGQDYSFLPKSEVLTFGEMVRTVRASVELGVRKVRLTGGEPLMRRGVEDLVTRITALEGVEDVAMTTNGMLLERHAENLKRAGLNRVTVSLDALDGDVFATMNGVGAKVERVSRGIEVALNHGLGVKVNTVVQRGVNEGEILPLLRWCREKKVTLRFIEFMDVGESNGWVENQVVSAAEILEIVSSKFPNAIIAPEYPGEVARRWRFEDGEGEFGIISSVTKPFCSACTRLRVSAEGKAFTCLFSADGADLKRVLRGCRDDREVVGFLRGLWSNRKDRYSEERGLVERPKAEMSYLGG